MKITWSRRAFRQLEDAQSHIARDNPRAADEFRAAVEALTAKLGEFPGMGFKTSRPGVIFFP